MTACVAYGCKNRHEKPRRQTGNTFHRFPTDPVLRQQWIDALNRKDFIPNKSSRVCSKHFREEDMDRTSLYIVRVRAGAVPSIFASPPLGQPKATKSKKIPKTCPAAFDTKVSSGFKVFLVSANCDNTNEMSEILCDQCKHDNKQRNAKGFCVDCDEYLCTICYNYHKKVRALKHHVVQDQNNMPHPSKKSRITDICVDKCSLHTDKVVEYFCEQCQQLGCSVCVAVTHRVCVKIEYIPKTAHTLSDDVEFRKIRESLTAISNDLEVIKNTIHSHLTDVETFGQKAIASVRKHRDEINQLFDKLEKFIVTEVKKIKLEDDEKLLSALTQNNKLIWTILAMKNDIESKKKSGKMCQLYVAMKKAEHEFMNMKTVMNGFHEQIKINRYEYQPAENVTNIIKSIKEMGTLITNKKIYTFVKELNMLASSNEKKCDISDLCLLSEHQLVGLDQANEAIKVIDISQNNIISVLDINTVPCCVTKIKDHHLAVTFPWQMQIQCFSVSTSGSLSAEQLIKVGGNCCGIAYYNGYLIVSYGKSSKVDMLDMTGKVLRDLSLDEMGQPLFANPGYLAFCATDRSIYVADIDRQVVIMLSLDGKVTTTSKAIDLVKPMALVVNNDKCIYVCDSELHQICVLSANLTKGQVLLDESHHLCKPQSLAYCSSNSYLFLGMENQNDIKVYHIC